MNVVMMVDPVWSWNLIGGMESFVDMSPAVISDVYTMATSWIKEINNHLVTRNSPVWNVFANTLNERIVTKYPLHPSYFVTYFNMLFNQLRPGLNTMNREISAVTPYCNEKGEIIALVVIYI